MAAPFDLVKQFDAMRQSSAAPTALASYQPPEVDLSPGPTSTVAGATPPMSARMGGRAGRLVGYGGYQYDEGVLPFVEEYTTRFGLRPSSGYRDPEHNRRVGGVPNSDHLTGRAYDAVGSADAMYRALAAARTDPRVRYATVHNVGSGQHLHISWR